MAVIDSEGRGWVSDPKGGIVRFGGRRSLEITAQQFKEASEKSREQAFQGNIDLQSLNDAETLLGISEKFAMLAEKKSNE